MCSLSTFALLFAITTTLAFASPVSQRQRRQVWAGGRIPADNVDDGCKCHALPKEVSDYCGYSTTALPNARGHTTVEKALSEFDDFAPLLTDSPCSDHLGVLLCFHYFPFGSCTHECQRVTPCNDTCEAAKSESCTDLVILQSPSGWANHLDCDQHESFPIEGVTTIPNSDKTTINYRLCVNTSVTIRKNFTFPASVVTTEVPSTSTTRKPEVTSSTEVPSTSTTRPTEASTTKGTFYKQTSQVIYSEVCHNYVAGIFPSLDLIIHLRVTIVVMSSCSNKGSPIYIN